MTTSPWVVFKSLVDHKDLSHFAGSHITPKLSEALAPIPNAPAQPLHISSPEELIPGIHYSWLIKTLTPFPQSDQNHLIQALQAPQQAPLYKHFTISPTQTPLSKIAKQYLLQVIYTSLISDSHDFLTKEYLPAHPLNTLTALSKQQLQSLITYLGLHDLATELKYLIKSKNLSLLHKALSSKEQAYLKEIAKNKQLITFSRINLENWDGDPTSMRSILEQRGSNRLAKALFGCHSSLLWHICHQLDTGRAHLIRKFFTDIKNTTAHQSLIQQILTLIAKVSSNHE